MMIRKTAFTIVEMMVVVAIIGILATLVTVNVVGAKQRANYTKVLADMEAISKAAGLSREETSSWPTTTSSGIPYYLPTFTSTPCNGYRYDWINVTEPVGGVNTPRQGVSFDKISLFTYIYYQDVNNFALYSAFATQKNAGRFTPASISSLNTVTCHES